MERTCKKCGGTKPIEEFKHSKKSGYSEMCLLCIKNKYLLYDKEYGKKYFIINKNRIKKMRAKYYVKNRDHIISKNNKYWLKYQREHKEEINEREKQRRDKMCDGYILELFAQQGISKEIIRTNPKLIELKKAQLKLLRLTG